MRFAKGIRTERKFCSLVQGGTFHQVGYERGSNQNLIKSIEEIKIKDSELNIISFRNVIFFTLRRFVGPCDHFLYIYPHVRRL